MSIAKQWYYQFSNCLPMGLLQKLAPATTLLPYHHTVSDDELHHIIHLYPYKNVAQFTDDLDYLLQHFNPIAPDDLLQHLRTHGQMPGKRFLLTFDDGFREIYDTVAPILEKKGVPAIFFVNPAFVDNQQLFYRCKTSLLIQQLKLQANRKEILQCFAAAMQLPANSTAESIIEQFKAVKYSNETVDNIATQIGLSFADYLQQQRPFVTTAQLHHLQQRGFTIGSHSWDHPNYLQINLAEQLRQTAGSSTFVQQTFGTAHQFFSFPYSDTALPQSLFDELQDTNVDALFGIQNQKLEWHNKMVHRFNAERPALALRKQTKGILLKMAIDRFTGKAIVSRKRVR